MTSCQTVQTTRGGVVGVDRPQQMSVFTPSAAEVDATAQQQYLQVMQGAAHKGALNRDPTQTARVQRVAQRLIPHTAVFRDDAVRWPWQVNVLSSPEVNAWCMPGGKMAVYTGLLTQLALTDDELAAVMGHEIAHALREHVRERMGRQQATAVGTAVGAAVLEYFTGVNPGEVGHTFTRPAATGSRPSGSRRIPRTRRVSVTCRHLRSVCCPCMRRRRSSGGRRPRDATWYQRVAWPLGLRRGDAEVACPGVGRSHRRGAHVCDRGGESHRESPHRPAAVVVVNGKWTLS
jgi:hypothetical protein